MLSSAKILEVFFTLETLEANGLKQNIQNIQNKNKKSYYISAASEAEG